MYLGPGYDNNKLANTMDSNYYSKLLNDSSRPLYNSATQEKTAPGSTYKPLSAIAGLSEGVITTSSIINCSGIYRESNTESKMLGLSECAWKSERLTGNPAFLQQLLL